MGVVSDCYCYVVYQQQQQIKIVLIQVTDVVCCILCMIQAMLLAYTKTTLEETHKKYLLLEKQTTLISCHVPRVI